MKSKLSSLFLLLIVCSLVLALANGCAFGVAGARVSLATPFSRPNFTYDSVGTTQKNSASGAVLPAKAGKTPAATADADTQSGGAADQVVVIVNDASNARSTDTGLSAKQGAAAGKGSISAEGARDSADTKTISPSLSVPVVP